MKKQNLCFRSGYSPDIAIKGGTIHRNKSHERSLIGCRMGEMMPESAHLTYIGDLLGVLSLVTAITDVSCELFLP